MKKIFGNLFFVFILAFCALPSLAETYNFGDMKSVTLVTKAWQALARNDLDGVLIYTDKCIELYADKAKKMQADLNSYPTGTNSEIFAYWALNDVATAYFIQGEALWKKGLVDEAKKAYRTVIEEYSFGQCWDPQGWFWKPAEASHEKLALMESGVAPDFSDVSSTALVQKAWEALHAKDVDTAEAYVKKILELYQKEARDMQASLVGYAWESREKVFSYWALNDVGTALYVLGKAYEDAGKMNKAQKAYRKLIKEFKYAQCWDPGGWFWKPAEEAQDRLEKLEKTKHALTSSPSPQTLQ